MAEIVECPHCQVSVVPSIDGVCPSCNHRVLQEPSVQRAFISSAEEAKTIRSIENHYKSRRIVWIWLAIILAKVLFSFASGSAELRVDLFLASFTFLGYLLLMPLETQRIRKLRKRLDETTTRS